MKLTRRVGLRMNREQRALVELAAEATDLGISGWIRAAIEAALKRQLAGSESKVAESQRCPHETLEPMSAKTVTSLRVSPDHLALVELATAAIGVSRSEWIRAAVTTALREQLAPTSPCDE